MSRHMTVAIATTASDEWLVLVGGLQAHRAVDLATRLEQRHLLDTCGEQLAPVLAEPRLGIALRRERLTGRRRRRAALCPAAALVPPCPRHGTQPSAIVGRAIAACGGSRSKPGADPQP